MANLVSTICQMTCSPTQSTFLEVKTTKVNPENNSTYITALDYYITQDFMDKIYDSCKQVGTTYFLIHIQLGLDKMSVQVSVPSTGQLALDLMCGNWGSLRCSSNRWFEYMGNTEGNPFVPFQINYINSTSAKVGNYTPLSMPVTPCSKPLDVSAVFLKKFIFYYLLHVNRCY